MIFSKSHQRVIKEDPLNSFANLNRRGEKAERNSGRKPEPRVSTDACPEISLPPPCKAERDGSQLHA